MALGGVHSRSWVPVIMQRTPFFMFATHGLLLRPDFTLIDHYTYTIAGDGCMQEGWHIVALRFGRLLTKVA